MSRKFFFYIKPTSETPKRFQKEIFDKNSSKPKIFRKKTSVECKFMAFSNSPQFTWLIRDNFEYVFLFSTRRDFLIGKPSRRLISGEDMIIVRLVIKGSFMLIILMICLLTRIRNRIKKKRLYFISILANNNQSYLNILSGHDLIKEHIFFHAFKKKKYLKK